MESWWLRLWPGVARLALLVGALQSSAAAIRLECVLPDDPDGRVYRLVDRGPSSAPRWWLTLAARSLGQRIVELPLAEAQVERTPEGALGVVNKSLNGGLTVVIRPEASAYLLDVFVNFELEVNVWRDLSPDVESMNTEGPRRDAGCHALSSPVRLS